MSTNEYIRQAASRNGWKKYYSLLRPVGIKTHPNGIEDFINYDTKTEIDGRMVWAELYYDRILPSEELTDYEMVRA